MEANTQHIFSEVANKISNLLLIGLVTFVIVVVGVLSLTGLFLLGTWVAYIYKMSLKGYFFKPRKTFSGSDEVNENLSRNMDCPETAPTPDETAIAFDVPCRAVREAEEIAREVYERLFGKNNPA